MVLGADRQAGSRIASWGVRVDTLEFWLHGVANQGTVQTREIAYSHLCVALGRDLSPGADRSADQSFVWYGGALVYEPDPAELADLIGVLNEAAPELAARQRELKMAQRIQQQPRASMSSAVARSALRRARL